MKRILTVLIVSWFLFAVSAAQFQNLDFDSGDISHIFDIGGAGRDFVGPVAELLPGWQFGVGPVVGYNLSAAGFGYASIYDTKFAGGGEVPVFGKYSLGMVPNQTPYVLVQVGDVPGDAKSIRFISSGAPVMMLMNGIPVQLVASEQVFTPTRIRAYNVAGDISAFAGTTAELKFIPSLQTLLAWTAFRFPRCRSRSRPLWRFCFLGR